MKKLIVFPAGRGLPWVEDVEGDFDWEKAKELIGGWIEIVRPRRLPNGFVMVVDEEGLLKRLPLNHVGSWFYETDKHGEPIVGTALILKEEMGPEGPELAGMTDDDVNMIFDRIGKEE